MNRDEKFDRDKVRAAAHSLDIARILRNPVMVGPAYKRGGEWRYRVTERPGNAPPERRGVQVVVVIVVEGHLQAHTVYRKR